MLAIFSKSLIDPPKELHSPVLRKTESGHNNNDNNTKPMYPEDIVKNFEQIYSQNAPLSIGFGNSAFLAYANCKVPQLTHQRSLCSMDNMYCIFVGNLNNLNTLIKQYGLSKSTNEAMFLIEAYRTLRDRGPYRADQVLNDLDGSFGFVIYDKISATVFAALGADQKVQLFWGIGGDGSVVISDNNDVIKASCAKSFAPFPSGCMYHSEIGLVSFEHPKNNLKAVPRIDSEGAMCGANFKVDIHSKTPSMPRVGSEANWAFSGSHA